MELRSAGGAVTLCLFVLCLLVSTSEAHNITRMLAKYPEFSTFNRYLSLTHLATDINRRLTITVCAIDNAAMNDLISKRYSIPTIKNVLSLHVFVDYWGAKKLHGIKHGTTLTSTMFQATGTAAGTTGYVNITNLKGGKVGFSVEDTNGVIGATFVKSIIERPYNISVIQISSYLDSPTAEAPTPPPPQVNLTVLMSKQGCKAFADLLTSTGVIGVFDENVEAGLTLFCPIDAAVTAFMPKYKNLTAGKKESLLLYHGTPIFFSLQLLKSNNELQSTLATEKVGTYDFTVKNSGETVTLQTKVQTSKILNTLIAQDPVAVYSIDKVLQPKELFKIPRAPAPVGSKLKPEGSVAEGPIDSDETTADGSGSSSISCGLWMGSILAVWFLGLFTM